MVCVYVNQNTLNQTLPPLLIQIVKNAIILVNSAMVLDKIIVWNAKSYFSASLKMVSVNAYRDILKIRFSRYANHVNITKVNVC